MPPYDRESADRFCEILAEIVKAKAFWALDGLQFALPDSILAAWRFNGEFAKLLDVIPRLFDEFYEEFGECIAEIIAATNDSRRIIQRAISRFGVDHLISNFVRNGADFPAETVNFFVFLVQQKIITELDERLRTFLGRLLDEVDTEKGRILQEMIDLGNERASLENMILDGVLPETSGCIERGMDVITSLLSSRTTSDLAVSFVIDAVERFPEVDYSDLLPALFDLFRPKYTKADVCCRMVIRRYTDLLPFVLDEKHRENAVVLLSWFLLRNRESVEFHEDLLEIVDVSVKLIENGSVSVCRSACVCLAFVIAGRGLSMSELGVKVHSVQQVMVEKYKEEFMFEDR
jgi:hypothetical protein